MATSTTTIPATRTSRAAEAPVLHRRQSLDGADRGGRLLADLLRCRCVTGTIAQPLLIHIHATVFTGWLVLFLTQAVLAATKQVTWHLRAREDRHRLWRAVGRRRIDHGRAAIVKAAIGRASGRPAVCRDRRHGRVLRLLCGSHRVPAQTAGPQAAHDGCRQHAPHCRRRADEIHSAAAGRPSAVLRDLVPAADCGDGLRLVEPAPCTRRITSLVSPHSLSAIVAIAIHNTEAWRALTRAVVGSVTNG